MKKKIGKLICFNFGKKNLYILIFVYEGRRSRTGKGIVDLEKSYCRYILLEQSGFQYYFCLKIT